MATTSRVKLHDGQSKASTDLAAADSISLSTALTELALAPVRLLTSPRALRTYASTILVLSASLILWFIAAVAYLLFYNSYIPDTSFTVPVHLQFDHLVHGVTLDPALYHPYAVAKFSDALRGVDIDGEGGVISWLLGGRGILGGNRKQRATGRMLSDLEYDIDVVMTMPRTPGNVAAGNFMLSLSLLEGPSSTATSAPKNPAGSGSAAAFTKPGLDPSAVVLAHSSRPVTLTYASPLLSYANQLLTMPLYMFNLRSEKELLRKPMLERIAFPATSTIQGATGVPQQLHLEVRSRERLQIYGASVEVRARFGGVRWIMSRHRIFSFAVFTTTFWGIEMFFALLIWAGAAFAFSYSSGVEPTGGKLRSGLRSGIGIESESSGDARTTARVKQEEDEEDDEDGPDLSDTSRSFPTYSRQPPLRYSSPPIKREEDDSVEGVGAGHDVEADDEGEGHEDEDADFVVDGPAGPGMAAHGAGRSGRADDYFDSGIGTSMESSGADRSVAGSMRRRKSDK